MNFMDQLDPELRVVLEAFPTEGAVNLNETWSQIVTC